MALPDRSFSKALHRALQSHSNTDSHRSSWPSIPLLHRRDTANDDDNNTYTTMQFSILWKRRFFRVMVNLLFWIWIAITYLGSELTIWALSMALAPVKLEFFASILGMLLLFILMTILRFTYYDADRRYMEFCKDKVDFINAHLGLGFPIPIVMLDQSDVLNGHDIACVIGNFIVTNIVSWTVIFAMSLGLLAAPSAFRSLTKRIPPSSTAPRDQPSRNSDSTLIGSADAADSPKRLSDAQQTPTSSRRSSSQPSDLSSERDASPWWKYFSETFPIALALVGVFVVGAPVAAGTGDERILDGCMLWFIWISSVRLQQVFKHSSILSFAPRYKNVFATLLNPVLATTLLMTSYTRLKAVAMPGVDFSDVLKAFSSGTPLYALWTASVSGKILPKNPTGYFGAGDAALSILECGILIWGFKLYECRRQLFSIAGILTAFISVAAAAGNVFLSVLIGRAMGLDRPEALAFAARSTTLALAKPAMEAAGGNPAVNAALVVSNGILGQLMYPFVLTKLGVKFQSDNRVRPSSQGSSVDEQEMRPLGQQSSSKEVVVHDEDDDPMTIAAGIAIGVNGAAMGVAYLYETRSRAAPYAALAMTVFGVMTVVFTTVEPFKGAVVALANG